MQAIDGWHERVPPIPKPYAPSGEKVKERPAGDQPDTGPHSIASRYEPSHLFDRARGTGARLQQVASHAQLTIASALDIKARVERLCGATAIERGGEDVAIFHEQQQPVIGRGLHANDVFHPHAAIMRDFAYSPAFRTRRLLRLQARADLGWAWRYANDHPLTNAHLAKFSRVACAFQNSQRRRCDPVQPQCGSLPFGLRTHVHVACAARGLRMQRCLSRNGRDEDRDGSAGQENASDQRSVLSAGSPAGSCSPASLKAAG